MRFQFSFSRSRSLTAASWDNEEPDGCLSRVGEPPPSGFAFHGSSPGFANGGGLGARTGGRELGNNAGIVKTVEKVDSGRGGGMEIPGGTS